MARCPIAAWHPLGDNPTHQPLIGKVRGIILHTAVGSLISTDGYFEHGNGEGYIGTESHFIVGGYGEIWQITDTARTADANLDGNSTLLSIETADTYAPFPAWSGENVPAWTQQQIESLARVVAWAANLYGFPLERMADSKPSTRGVGYHRLGIDPWRVDGGESWTTTPGKVCPGDRRIAQVDQVIALARQGAKPPWPVKGDHTPAVRDMQRRLKNNDYATGKDKWGYFGAGTTTAVKKLQLAYDDTKADPDGAIGPLTWAHIEALALPAPPPYPPPGHLPFPLVDVIQRAKGVQIRADEAVIAAEQAAVAAHPKWQWGADMLGRDTAVLTQNQSDWATTHRLNHPKES